LLEGALLGKELCPVMNPHDGTAEGVCPIDGPADGPSLRTNGVLDGAIVAVLLQKTIFDTPTGPLTLISILPTCSMPSKTLVTDPRAVPGTTIVCTPWLASVKKASNT
jgi:hypothetical protein